MSNQIHPIELPPEFLTAIGRVMVNFSQLEAIVDFVLIKLLGAAITDVRFHAVFSQFAVLPKLEILQTLSKILSNEEGNVSAHRHFETNIFPKLKDLSAKRNWIAHSKWAIQKGKIFRSRLSAKGKFKVSESAVSTEELNKIAEDIVQLSGEIWGMVAFPEFHQPGPS